MPLDPVRLDKWLWAARFYKTRALAAEAIDGGKVEVNGERAKRARALHPGDEVRVRQPPYEQVVVVRELSERRGPASEAVKLYEERPQSVERRAALRRQIAAVPPPAPGRPTKRDRRELRRLKGDE
ncbi:MAG: RNA-binding S4 domain-containing protein [Gemmatimonadales bacterium]